MQKWEYIFVDLDYRDDGIRSVNGNALKDKNVNLFEFVNQLGRDGWELAGIDSSFFVKLVFKRPVG